MLRDKEQLIKWLIKATQNDIVLRTALRTGRIVHLGVHDPLPSSERRGWVVQTITKHNHVYHLAVPMNQFGEPVHFYEVSDEDVGALETNLPRRASGESRGPSIHPSADWGPCAPPICEAVDERPQAPTTLPPAV